MKSLEINIILTDKETIYYEKTSKGLTADEVRRCIAMLEEIKLDLIHTLMEKREFRENKKIKLTT